MRKAALRQQERSQLAVKPREFIQTVAPKLSITARKLWVHLIHAAGGNAWRDDWHTARIKDLRLGSTHESNDRLRLALRELAKAYMEIELPSTTGGQPEIKGGAYLADWHLRTAAGEEGVLRFRISSAMQEVARRSNIYAELSVPIVAALSSGYAIALYERGMAHVRLTWDKTWRVSIADFRATVGVPANKHRDFADVRRFVIENPLVELNALAPFVTEWRTEKAGRKVTGLVFTFTPRAEYEQRQAPRPPRPRRRALDI